MRITALLYHDVVPEGRFDLSGFQSPDANRYKLGQDEFRSHLRAIASQSRAPGTITAGALDDNRLPVLLTFDDGGAGAWEAAAMLDEYGWPGHFFITTDRIGTAGFVDEARLRAIRQAGHSIGSHSCSHPERMPSCTSAELDHEWRDSIRRLEDILGEPVTSASIPCGFYTRRIAGAAAAAGIRVLFTSEPVTVPKSIDGCLVIGRFCARRGVPARWVADIVADRPLPRMGQFLAWNSRKILRAAGGPAWLKLRKFILAGERGR